MKIKDHKIKKQTLSRLDKTKQIKKIKYHIWYSINNPERIAKIPTNAFALYSNA